MGEITKERADEITAAWDAASDTARLSMPRMHWVNAGDATSYFEEKPSKLELKAAARIADLEAALVALIDAVDAKDAKAIESALFVGRGLTF